MKRYVKSSIDYDRQLLHMTIEDLFKEFEEASHEIDEDNEWSAEEIADFIADHFMALRDRDEWRDLAFNWLNARNS